MKKRLVLILVVLSVIALYWSLRPAADFVVIYVSHDRIFSEPVLRDFNTDTGIQVRAIYDTEETKGTGVMNRLIAERDHPQADVYWANEPLRTVVLKKKGISAPYRSPNAVDIPDSFKDPHGYWTGFAARARVLLMRNDLKPMPMSIAAYSDARLQNTTVIANPLFGTTTTHAAALFVLWGPDRFRNFMAQVKTNGVKIASSNGESADLIISGEFAFGLVDSDDAVTATEKNTALTIVYPDQGENEIGCLVIPNAVALIKNAPHEQNAKKLIDYLLNKDTERKLAFSGSAQMPLRSGISTPPHVPQINKLKTMRVDYEQMASAIEKIQLLLKDWVEH
ncbi:MAG: extracellular solute-binding protein [Gammaproteobacteria bacterium]|nr:extracellular solute-binding protein [Gammaproteobacteria bacterium]